jgi:hypothetical protein
MKKLTVMLLVIMMVFSIVPVNAAQHDPIDTQDKIIYQREITVTERGGVYQVGFVTVKFPKDFIDEDQLPIKINVKITAEDGKAGIEFTPDIPNLNRNVIVNVHSYNGLLYDGTLGRNIRVHVKHQILILEHFSRYAFS